MCEMVVIRVTLSPMSRRALGGGRDRAMTEREEQKMMTPRSLAQVALSSETGKTRGGGVQLRGVGRQGVKSCVLSMVSLGCLLVVFNQIGLVGSWVCVIRSSVERPRRYKTV